MRKLISMLLALLCVVCLVPGPCLADDSAPAEDPFAPVASASTDQASQAQGTIPLNTRFKTSNNSTGSVPRSPSKFTTAWPLESAVPRDSVNKLNMAISDLAAAAASIIVPVAVFSMMVSCTILVLGGLIGWGAARRFGLSGLFTTCAGLLVYYGHPLIIGLIRALVMRLN